MQSLNSSENVESLQALNTNDLVKIITILQNNTEQLQKQNQLLQTQNQKIQSRVAQLEKNIQVLETKIISGTEAADAKLLTFSQEQLNLLEKLKPQLKTMYETLQKKQSESKDLILTKISSIEKQQNAYENQLKDQATQITTLNSDSEKFKGELKEQKAKLDSVQDHKSSEQNSSNETQHIKEQIIVLMNQTTKHDEQLREENIRVTELRNELQKSSEEIKKQLEEHKAKLSSVQDHNFSDQSSSNDTQHVKEQIVTLTNQTTKHEEQLKEQNTHVAALRDELQKGNEEIRKQLEEHKAKLSSVQDHNVSDQISSKETQHVKEQIVTLTNQTNKHEELLKEQNTHVAALHDELQKNNEQVKKQLEEQNPSNKIQHLQEQISSLESQTDLQKEQIEDVKNGLTKFNTRYKFHQDATVSELKNVSQKFEEISKKSTAIDNKVNHLNTSMNSCTQDINALFKSVAVINTKTNSSKDSSSWDMVNDLPEKRPNASKPEQNEKSSESIFSRMANLFSKEDTSDSQGITAPVHNTPHYTQASESNYNTQVVGDIEKDKPVFVLPPLH